MGDIAKLAAVIAASTPHLQRRLAEQLAALNGLSDEGRREIMARLVYRPRHRKPCVRGF